MTGLLANYDSGAGYDEVFERPGVPRASCVALVKALEQLGPGDLADARRRADVAFLNAGITFTVYTESSGIERIFPFDLVPRVIDATEWDKVERGLKQRVVALNAFLQDVYNDQRIVLAGVIPAEAVFGSRNYQPAIRGFTPPNGVWIHVSGIDLVRDSDGTIYVLEDNVRTPSGVSYVIQNRVISMRAFPRIYGGTPVRSVADYANRLHDTVKRCWPDGAAVVLTPGVYNSAYFEHSFLAKQMGVQLVEGRDMFVRGSEVGMKTTHGFEPVGAIYRRVDDEYLDPLNFLPDSTLGVPGLFESYRAGKVCLVNGIGTGLADDKSVYPYVPAMIRFYLGEEPILPNVPTFRGADPKDLDHMLSHMAELVVKPANASGGYGVVIGPAADERLLDRTAEAVKADPAGFIAQPLIRLSTCPTLIDGEFKPRRIDLRPFVLYDGVEPWVLPGGLTRVALQEGSFIVNSSQGGGSKDTWVLDGAA
ncbi:MAG: circularly permuted type 2 ATP-grasp protein [Dehalococcoidia bacterium]